MPKLRVKFRWAALVPLLAIPLALAGCDRGGSSGGGGSGDATLSAISFSAGTLNPTPFVPGTTNYFLSVPFGTTSVTVTPTASDAGASITVAQDSGAPLAVASGSASQEVTVPAVGARSAISVVVTAADGRTTQRYGFLLTQFVSHDATLSALSTSVGTLTPAFSSATTG